MAGLGAVATGRAGRTGAGCADATDESVTDAARTTRNLEYGINVTGSKEMEGD